MHANTAIGEGLHTHGFKHTQDNGLIAMYNLVQFNTKLALASFIDSSGRYYLANGPGFVLVPTPANHLVISQAKSLAASKNITFNKEIQASSFISASQKVVDLDRVSQLIYSMPSPLQHIDNPASARKQIHRRLEEALRSNTLTPEFVDRLTAFNATYGLSAASKNLIRRVDPSLDIRTPEKDIDNKGWDRFAQDFLGMVHSLLIKQGKFKEAKFALVQLQSKLSPQGEVKYAKAIEELYEQTHYNPHRDKDEELKPWQRSVSSSPNPFKGQKKKWL